VKQIWRLLLVTAVVLLLWNTQIIQPLKGFAIAMYQLGQALMAFIFSNGGRGYQLSTFTRFMIICGGYLGGVIFAAFILYFRKTALKKYILGTLAILFLLATLKISGFVSFPMLYSVVFAIFVLMLYMVQNEKVYDWAIDVIVALSIAFTVYDVLVATIFRQLNLQFHFMKDWAQNYPTTGAEKMGELTHLPALLWGIIWLFIVGFAIVFYTYRKPRARKAALKTAK
jgi:hypothetical protein